MNNTNIENDLKKDGITIVKPVDTLTITLIAKFVAEKLTTTFIFYGLKQNDLFVRIARVPMYIAKIPDGMSEANYLYKNSSIYFKEGLSIEEMQVEDTKIKKKPVIHEKIEKSKGKRRNG